MTFDSEDAWLLSAAALVLALAVLLAGGCATAPAATRTVAQQRAAAVEVAVACEGPLNLQWMQVGSGVLVDDRHVVTARHVVNCDVAAVLVVTAGGRQIGASVEILAPMSDLARLELERPVATAPPVTAPARLSTVCMVVAYPRRYRVCGPVSQLRSAAMQDLGIGIPAVQGNSGAGIYDQAGRLVGIATHRCAVARCTYATTIAERAWILVTR